MYADFRILHYRYGTPVHGFRPFMCNQNDECGCLAGTHCTKGFTQEQVGEVFLNIYGELHE